MSTREMTNLERLIDDRFNKMYEKLKLLESKYDEINFKVDRLTQDSSDLLGFVEEIQDSVEAIKSSTSKTNRFIRRISQTHNGPNDFSRLVLHKKPWSGSTDSFQTASRESETDSCQEERPRLRGKNSRRKKDKSRMETTRDSPPPEPSRPTSKGFEFKDPPRKLHANGNLSSNNERQEHPESPDEDTNKPAQQPPVSKPTGTNEKTLSLPTPQSHTETPGAFSATVSRETLGAPSAPVSRETLGAPSASVSKEVPVPAPSSVDYHSPEGFLQSLNIQIQDPVLMSALSGIFNGTPSNTQLPTGLYTILLIDVSSSVHMTLFKQIQAFVEQMVNEVENSAAEHNLEEMMAVLKFGGQCEVIQHFTNDYMPVKDSLADKVNVGGRSPMLFGLAMALAYCHKFGKRVKVNGQIINPRIIVFTDGYATDIHDKQACIGKDCETNVIKVQSDVFKFLAAVQNSPVNIDCVGVGECNQVFLQEIAKMCHGQFVLLSGDQNPCKLGRYYLYQDALTRTKKALEQGDGTQDLREAVRQHSRGSHYTDQDRAEIVKLLQLDPVHKTASPSAPSSGEEDKPPRPTPVPTPKPTHVEEEPPKPNIPSTPAKPNEPKANVVMDLSPVTNIKPVQNLTVPKKPVPDSVSVPSTPEVEGSDAELFDAYGQPRNRCHPWGTRVIRGENWKWTEDQNMPGTVVAHKAVGEVVVKWDCGAHGEYPQENLFRITETRALKQGEVIEVGCSVKRGPDWDRGEEDGGETTVGTVIRKHSNNTVSVIWPYGVVEIYKYDERKKEVEVLQNASAPQTSIPMALGGNPEPDTRDPMAGELVVWQWIDSNTNEFHTFTKEEALKLEDVYKKKAGTTLVGYKGQQLRCQPTQWKYRDCGGRGATGVLHRRVCSHDEAETFYLIETM